MIVVAELESTVAFRDGGQAVQVCPPDHKHGATGTCYTAHTCRCAGCRAGHALQKRTTRRLKAYGRWDESHRTPWAAIAHLHVLTRFGYSYEQIARAAGINARTVYRIIRGHETSIHARVHRAILSVQPTLDDLDPGTRIPTRGARRRLQALACLGWSVEALAARLGVSRSALSQRASGATMTVASHLALAALFDALWDQHPVASSPADAGMILRTQRHAQAQGWLPPLAWDDIDADAGPALRDEDIDDVDVIAVQLAVEGGRIPLTMAERRLAVAQLHALRYSDKLIAQMLLVDAKTISADRAVLGLPTVEAPVTAREQAA